MPILRLTAFALVAGLALPAVANGQAIPRGGSSAGSTASSGGSGSSGSSSSGSTSSGEVSQPPSNPSPSRIPTDTPGTVLLGKGGGHGPSPTAPPPGGTVAAASITPMIGVSGAERRTGTGDTSQGFSSSLNMGRQRGDNAITGFAAPRQPRGLGGDGDFVSFPFWGPWGQWYPWYGAGFGYSVGFYGYNPWYYGATCWGWGRWGTWYDPFGYCWNPLYYGPSTYVEIAGAGGREKLAARTGNLRIIASPKTANIYIDDALVGTVDEFDGLSDHLEVSTGRHVVSLRADGYQPAVQDVTVEGGRTQTVRITLKKLK